MSKERPILLRGRAFSSFLLREMGFKKHLHYLSAILTSCYVDTEYQVALLWFLFVSQSDIIIIIIIIQQSYFYLLI